MNPSSPHDITLSFYALLRQEVVGGNPALDRHAQAELCSHYPVMMSPETNPPALAAAIYAQRRQYPVAAIQTTNAPVVLDAGCGYGSESFLFASLGARVLAVDTAPERIRIARLRQPFFEQHIGRALDISFQVADLDTFTPPAEAFSLTWLASVLAAVTDQRALLARTAARTRAGGKLMVTDMNLWNPLFLYGEWQRRRRAAATNPAFRRAQNFGAMLARRGRAGARYFPYDGTVFDDVQFFQPRSLAQLYRASGWQLREMHFSGYIPPALARRGLDPLEAALARIPVLSAFGYFYLGIAQKQG